MVAPLTNLHDTDVHLGLHQVYHLEVRRFREQLEVVLELLQWLAARHLLDHLCMGIGKRVEEAVHVDYSSDVEEVGELEEVHDHSIVVVRMGRDRYLLVANGHPVF